MVVLSLSASMSFWSPLVQTQVFLLLLPLWFFSNQNFRRYFLLELENLKFKQEVDEHSVSLYSQSFRVTGHFEKKCTKWTPNHVEHYKVKRHSMCITSVPESRILSGSLYAQPFWVTGNIETKALNEPDDLDHYKVIGIPYTCYYFPTNYSSFCSMVDLHDIYYCSIWPHTTGGR